MIKKVFIFCLIFIGSFCFAQDLSIDKDDVRLIRDSKAGYHLYIRKKNDIASVLVTETTKDPYGIVHNYAFRDPQWNPINGDELRILNGRFLSLDSELFSLTDSTPEQDEIYGKAFHIFIPPILEYGYPWGRNGTEILHKGLFINIRAFEKPFADYDGAFKENPFVVDLIPPSPSNMVMIEEDTIILIDEFRPEVVESLSNIAKTGKGQSLFSVSPEEIFDKLQQILLPVHPDKSIDIILTIDATASMADDIKYIRKTLPILLEDILSQYKSFRIGLVFYKDYSDDFIYKKLPVRIFPFTSNINEFKRSFNSLRVSGGGDVPEPVYEALYASLVFFEWEPDAIKKIILIGDAEPHPIPRGTKLYTKALIDSLVEKKQVEVNVIILMDGIRPN